MADRDQPVYVYGVLPADAAIEPNVEGIEEAGPSRLVRDEAGGVAMLLADASDGLVPTTRRNLKAHAEVLAEAARATTVLPMQFGVVFPSEQEAGERLLRDRGAELVSLLDRYRGQVEVTLLGSVADEDALLREIVQEEAEIARLREEVGGVPEDAGYYARIRLGELVAAALELRRATQEQLILDRLEPFATATERDREVPPRVIVKAAFLLERTRLDEFDREVEAIGRELDGRVRFSYAGPLALHSFADLGSKPHPVPA